jgi:meiotic recombination protein SPO11
MSSPPPTIDQVQESTVVRFIEDLLASILDELMEDNASPSITFKKRPSRATSTQISPNGSGRDGGVLEVANESAEKFITYSWPGKTPYEAWKFSTKAK